MRIERYDVRSLHHLSDNPRSITDTDIARLRQSIESYGLFKPLLVWADDEGRRHVIGGNQRLSVLTAMAESDELPITVTLRSGAEVEVTAEVPCIEFPGTEVEAKAVALRDNNADGEWDWDMLPDYVSQLTQDLGADADIAALTGFDDAMLDDLTTLATAYDVDLAFVGEEPLKPPEAPERRLIKFGFGKVSGMVPIDLYDRWLQLFTDRSKALDSKEIKVVLADFLNLIDTETP